MDNRETTDNKITKVEQAVSQKENLPSSTPIVLNKEELNKESLEILNQLIAENDVNKTKDLTYLFNINQNKKTMIRVNKLNELLDLMADQTMTRFSERPDEISNQELLQGLKVVQDIVERGQKQVAGVTETPLIQVNQQNNEINLGDGDGLSKESRDRVKNAVLAILEGINKNSDQSIEEQDIIEVQPEETSSESEEDN